MGYSMCIRVVEVRDSVTDTIPVDVRLDPESDAVTHPSKKRHWLIEQDAYDISITLDMARGIVAAIEMLEAEMDKRKLKESPEG